MSSDPTSRRSRRSVNIFQVIALMLAFVLLSGVGGVLVAGMTIPVAATAGVVTTSATDAFEELPENLDQGRLSEASFIYAADGTLLATYFDDSNRVIKPLSEISINLQNAVIAIEDKRFYSHGGIDPRGMMRAFVNNAMGKDTQGASTLTQQYVKNVLIENANRAGDAAGILAAKEQTEARKLREAKLAISLEKTMTKDEILAGYLNIAQFGQRLNGAETAAQRYFGKSAADLSIVEAATIAGVTKWPEAYDPIRFPAQSQGRRDLVLKEMFAQGYITREDYTTALSTPLADTLNVQPINQGCMNAPGGSGYFCDYVTKVILQDPVFGETLEEREELLGRGGLTIKTTIDLGKQAIADEELRNGIPVDDPNGFADALTSIDPKTGHILVMAQNRTYDARIAAPAGSTAVNYNTGLDYGGSHGFQAGSTYKAFILAEWFNEGHRLLDTVNVGKQTWTSKSWVGTPASCLLPGSDPPTPASQIAPWTPGNSEGESAGSKTVLQATQHSINTGFVAMASKLNLCGIAATAESVGYRPANDGPIQVNPAALLGSQETTPLSMASAFGTFANNGMRCDPIAILSVTRKNPDTLVEEELAVPQANCRQVMETSTVNAVNYALQQVLRPGGNASKAALAGHTAAGKTGTTNNAAAAWFIGYTPNLVTAVWNGHPEGNKHEMRNVVINGVRYSYVYGATIAAPTWKRYMDRVLAGTENVGFPGIAPAQMGAPPAPAPTAPPTSPAEPATATDAPPAG